MQIVLNHYNINGKTEWVYAYQKSIDDVFTLAYEKYGGTLHNYKITKNMFFEENKSPYNIRIS